VLFLIALRPVAPDRIGRRLPAAQQASVAALQPAVVDGDVEAILRVPRSNGSGRRVATTSTSAGGATTPKCRCPRSMPISTEIMRGFSRRLQHAGGNSNLHWIV
jgi:hypothetical protein